MSVNVSPEQYFKGVFVSSTTTVKQKLKQIKVFVFDWDGVFNDGRKNIDGHSSFSEVDSMGINLMRFSYYLTYKKLPVTVVITGEHNELAFSFAKRENFHAVYYKTANKDRAIVHLCEQYNVSPADILFVFDDVLDFSAAKLAGVRFMVGRPANPLLYEFAIDNRLVDYITKFDGNHNAIREISEMVMAMGNNFDITIDNRMKFSEAYRDYLALRKSVDPEFFTAKDNQISKQ